MIQTNNGRRSSSSILLSPSSLTTTTTSTRVLSLLLLVLAVLLLPPKSTTTTTLLLFVQAQVNVEFCGVEKACRIPINDESCKQLQLRYNFFGSCCHLEEVPGTGGCRVIVTAGGNCGWTPKCSNTVCKESTKCNIEFQTQNTEVCGVDNYNVLSQVQEPPKPCPTEAPELPEPTEPPAKSGSTSTFTRTRTITTRTMTMTILVFLSLSFL